MCNEEKGCVTINLKCCGNGGGEAVNAFKSGIFYQAKENTMNFRTLVGSIGYSDEIIINGIIPKLNKTLT